MNIRFLNIAIYQLNIHHRLIEPMQQQLWFYPFHPYHLQLTLSTVLPLSLVFPPTYTNRMYLTLHIDMHDNLHLSVLFIYHQTGWLFVQSSVFGEKQLQFFCLSTKLLEFMACMMATFR